MITITVDDFIDSPHNDVPSILKDPLSGGSISITSSIPGTNAFVESQFPSFVSEDHPKFVEFIEQYYRWMESKGRPLYDSKALKSLADIDTTDADYEEHLFNEFLSILPRTIVADKTTVLKHAKQFYRARGTEKSFQFLFRILFNSTSYNYYPKTDILKVSDGKWVQNKTIRVLDVTGDVKNFRAKRIVGKINNTSAFVERVYGINFGSYAGYELVLNTSSITGKFSPDEVIVAADDSVSAVLTPIPEKIVVIRGGKNYKVGDRFPIEHVGSGAVVRVANVDSSGSITKLYIEEYGVGYNVKNAPSRYYLTNNTHTQYVNDTQFDNEDTAVINVILGTRTNYPGYFRNEDGQPSARKYIHDGEFYQQFSYVTYCEQSYDTYSDILKKTLHPLGFKHYAGVLANSFASARVRSTGTIPVKLLSYERPHETLNAKIKHHETTINDVVDPKTINALGPSYHSVLRDKFTYKPFIAYDANAEVPQDVVPFQYYGPKVDSSGKILTTKLSSTPVSAFEYGKISFEKLKVNSIKDNFGPRHLEGAVLNKTNYSPDSCVILNQDRVLLSITSSPTIVISEGDVAPKTLSFEIKNSTENRVTGKVLINGKHELLQFVPPNSVPVEDTYTIDIDLSAQSIVSSGSELGSVVWSISYTLFGTTTTSTVTLPYYEFRVALFVEDNLHRAYKSDNIGIKFLPGTT